MESFRRHPLCKSLHHFLIKYPTVSNYLNKIGRCSKLENFHFFLNKNSSIGFNIHRNIWLLPLQTAEYRGVPPLRFLSFTFTLFSIKISLIWSSSKWKFEKEIKSSHFDINFEFSYAIYIIRKLNNSHKSVDIVFLADDIAQLHQTHRYLIVFHRSNWLRNNSLNFDDLWKKSIAIEKKEVLAIKYICHLSILVHKSYKLRPFSFR